MQESNYVAFLPDEFVSGYLLRRAWAVGIDQQRIRSALCGRLPAQTSKYAGWRIVPDLDREAAADVSIFSENEALQIAENHSTARVYLPTTHPDLVASMAKLFERGGGATRRDMPVGLEQIHKNPAHTRMRFCPVCFHEQVAAYGIAYFRRSWAVPYIENCVLHGVKLQGVGCPHCGGKEGVRDLRRNFEQFCSTCGTDLWSVQKDLPTNFSLLVNNWFEDLLEEPLPFLTHSVKRRILVEVGERLDGRRFNDVMQHRCTRECDPFSCTGRVRWMLNRDGEVDGRSLVARSEQNTKYMGVPSFLMFWLPTIIAFRTAEKLRHFLFNSGWDDEDREMGLGVITQTRPYSRCQI